MIVVCWRCTCWVSRYCYVDYSAAKNSAEIGYMPRGTHEAKSSGPTVDRFIAAQGSCGYRGPSHRICMARCCAMVLGTLSTAWGNPAAASRQRSRILSRGTGCCGASPSKTGGCLCARSLHARSALETRCGQVRPRLAPPRLRFQTQSLLIMLWEDRWGRDCCTMPLHDHK